MRTKDPNLVYLIRECTPEIVENILSKRAQEIIHVFFNSEPEKPVSAPKPKVVVPPSTA